MSLISCPECHQQMSTKAELCPHCGAKQRKKNNPILVIVLLLIIIVSFSIANRDSEPTYRAEPAAAPVVAQAAVPRTPGIGENCQLWIDDGEIPVAVTEADFQAMQKHLLASDWQGIMDLMLQDRVFLVQRGTRCRVISQGFERRELRILRGPMAGRSGWVQHTVVRPLV